MACLVLSLFPFLFQHVGRGSQIRRSWLLRRLVERNEYRCVLALVEYANSSLGREVDDLIWDTACYTLLTVDLFLGICTCRWLRGATARWSLLCPSSFSVLFFTNTWSVCHYACSTCGHFAVWWCRYVQPQILEFTLENCLTNQVSSLKDTHVGGISVCRKKSRSAIRKRFGVDVADSRPTSVHHDVLPWLRYHSLRERLAWSVQSHVKSKITTKRIFMRLFSS